MESLKHEQQGKPTPEVELAKAVLAVPEKKVKFMSFKKYVKKTKEVRPALLLEIPVQASVVGLTCPYTHAHPPTLTHNTGKGIGEAQEKEGYYQVDGCRHRKLPGSQAGVR